MSRRHTILGAGLAVVMLAAAGTAWWLWDKERRAVAAFDGIPAAPDVSRWPMEFSQRLRQEDSAVRKGQDSTAALGRYATLYFVNGFAAEANHALEVLRRIDPKNARWPYLVADLKLRVADNAGAEAALREVVQRDPSYAPAWIKLGDLLVARAAYAEAERCFTQAATVVPGEVRAAFALISFEAFHGKRGDPRKELQQLVASNPGIKPLHELLAKMNEAAGDTTGAATQRRLAAESKRYLPLHDPWIDELYVDSFDPNRLTLLSGKMEREGRYADAVARLERAITLAPTEPALRNSLAQVRIVANQPEEAVTVLRQAVTDCPDDPALRERLAMLLRTGKRYDDAIAVARAAVARWPQNPDMQTALGQALRESGQMQAALSVLLNALQLDSSQAEANYATGYCLLALGRRDEAKTYVAKALEIRPDYTEALKLQAGMAIEEGDVVAAEPAINQLMTLRAGQDDVRLLYAALHLIKGNMARDAGNAADAFRFFRAGLEVFPEFPPLLREAGLLARSQGRADEARRYFEQGVRAAEAMGNTAEAAEFRQLLGR